MSDLSLLVVDDEIDFTVFVSAIASEMNFTVLSTDNPLEFEKLYSPHINIIVLDLFMPHIDGIELLRSLYEKKSDASIVFMSGKDNNVLQAAQKLAVEQGLTVLGILQKPFRAEDLQNILSKYAQKTHARNFELIGSPSVSELRQAIDREDLFLVYQPQINISTRRITGLEALIRWNHPTKGRVPVSYFIPLAEEAGLISDLTTHAINTALKQMALWNENGLNLQMSINVSPKILDDLDFPGKLVKLTRSLNLDITKITIEVTESSLMPDVARYMDILARLRMKGFRLAIDDFGTGYSTLQQLVRAPFSELKIDQSFVKRMDIDKECRSIVEISILLAHKLGMKVIAEGIENEDIHHILQELNCDEGQGFLIAKPMLASELKPWIEKYSFS
ncbi:MAG: EAL domain-containing response regulator [Emcibacter sp.]|nr:EAL domain-containing response regulator [Emcibacter sp.]